VLGRRESAWRPALKEAQRLFQEGAIARLQPGCAPHASYSLAARGLREIFALGRCRRWPLTIHFAESPAESHWLLHGGGGLAARLDPAAGWRACLPPPPGRNPTAYLEGLGGLYPGNLLVHGVQVNARDVQLLARRRVTLVLCPRSNERLGVGRAPVARYRATGVKLALGTDSLASNDSLSMWEELAAARRCYGPKLSPAELLAMATCNGADALGLKGEMGALRAGFGAHFQVLPLRDPPPLRELEEFLCSHGCDSLPSALYLAGEERLTSGGKS